MKKNKWLYPLFDIQREVTDRMFMLVSAVAMIALILLAICMIIYGLPTRNIATVIISVILFGVIIALCIRFRRPKLGGIIISFLMSFIMFPLAFFRFGGLFGGMVLWLINLLFYISLVLSGRTKYAFMVASVVIAGVCVFISLRFPESVTPHSAKELAFFNIVSLVLVGGMDFFMTSFCIRIFQDENRRAKEQAKKIEELNAAQNRFFSSMSHEIRTPVNTIIGLNEMILREAPSDEILENAENIEAAGKMLLQVINDILDMSRIESGQMTLTNSAYRTEDMLSEIVGMLWLRAKEKDLEFRVDVSPNLPEELYGDEIRIRQILINVLTNAIKYTNEGSVTLQIQCERTGEGTAKMIYTVTDTGIGIKKENIPYLFTAFRRVNDDKSRYVEGTGLGLSITKNLVDLMDGSISVNSIYTKGSTFVIEIPQQIISDRQVGEIQPGLHRTSGKRIDYYQSFEAPDARVLVVDDNASNLLVVKKLLRDTKIQITTVSSGIEALEKTLNEEFHLILMDHLMPKMDGIECLHQIRTQAGGRCRDVKIIVLTANAGGDYRALYTKEGFDGYLVKPISGKDLERELYHALPPELVYETEKGDTIIEESMAWISDHQKRIPVAITTESVSDLPPSMLSHLNISSIPHMVATGDGLFQDGIELDTRGLLEYMKDPDAVISDRAPDASDYESFFAQALQSANNVIHLSISSKVRHSGCPAAIEAAKSFDNVFVADTNHISCGQGLMVLEANRMAKEGLGVPEIMEHLDEAKSRINTSFIVDNIDYLALSNQIGPVLSLFTKAFMLHPVISMKKGKMALHQICIGSREKCREHFVKSAFRKSASIDNRVLFISHVGLNHRELENIRMLACQKVPFEHVYIQEASPAIAVNCGPGTFGLVFMKKI